jgi:hypothetical protein
MSHCGSAEPRSTERRRNRTYRAVGYTTAPVLKPCRHTSVNGLNKPFAASCAPVRASSRASPESSPLQHRNPGTNQPSPLTARRGLT